MEKTTRSEAGKVAGRRLLFRVGLASAEGREDGWLLYELKGPDEFTVHAKLTTLEHPPSKFHGGFREYRLYAVQEKKQTDEDG